jgi:hypothetical protein
MLIETGDWHEVGLPAIAADDTILGGAPILFVGGRRWDSVHDCPALDSDDYDLDPWGVN